MNISSRFVGEKSHDLFGQLAESWRLGILIAKNSQFMADEWVLGYVNLHLLSLL